MRYTLLMHYPEATQEELGDEAMQDGMAAFDAFAKAIDEASVLVSAAAWGDVEIRPSATRYIDGAWTGGCGAG